jgi:Uma2 family endonuclease
MAGDTIERQWVVSMETFQRFRDERPESEKWELIDGHPIRMPPPSLTHQRISRNLETLLNDRLLEVRPEWAADREIGVLIPQDSKYNPEPDVTVIDVDYRPGQIYAERFYFVAEVLSGNDKGWVLDLKLAYYFKHEPCLAVLFVNQDKISAGLYLRSRQWQKIDLLSPADRLDIPGIGDIGALADLYRFTPLAVQNLSSL